MLRHSSFLGLCFAFTAFAMVACSSSSSPTSGDGGPITEEDSGVIDSGASTDSGLTSDSSPSTDSASDAPATDSGETADSASSGNVDSGAD